MNTQFLSIVGLVWIGWQEDGLQGHVSATADNQSVFILIKEMFSGILRNSGPTGVNEKLNVCPAHVITDWTRSNNVNLIHSLSVYAGQPPVPVLLCLSQPELTNWCHGLSDKPSMYVCAMDVHTSFQSHESVSPHSRPGSCMMTRQCQVWGLRS